MLQHCAAVVDDRGFSISKAWMEDYKCTVKCTAKSKGLRKEKAKKHHQFKYAMVLITMYDNIIVPDIKGASVSVVVSSMSVVLLALEGVQCSRSLDSQ